MSYMKFTTAVSDEMRRLEESIGPAWKMKEHWARLRQAERTVFDAWLADERFEELVSYLHSNYENGGGDEYINRVSQKLIALRDVRLLKRLWRGVTANRTGTYWTSRRYSKGTPKDRKSEAREKKHALKSLMAFADILEMLSDPDWQTACEDIELLKADKKRKSVAAADKRRLTEAVFWELIETAKNQAASVRERVEILRESLSRFSAANVKRFHTQLLLRLHELNTSDIWALAYIVHGGCSDDAFDYFRQWIITEGKAAFELAKSSVEQFAETVGFSDDPQCEELLSLAPEVYEEKKAAPLAMRDGTAEEACEPQWQEEDLPKLFPGICKKFDLRV
jgi:hypothetical protein